ncbi:MAG: hypothetical protein RBR38_11555 [Desulfomicrobium apsheronum]|nr:hypothetical protein [Desulfomicrobium apsheronum]
MSAKTNFIKPRLVGKRYGDHSIPLDLLRDISFFQPMVYDVAKWIFQNEHPERKRCPKGFLKGISLNLSSIEPGSAYFNIDIHNERPQLDPFLFPLRDQTYCEKARDQILKTISEANNGNNLENMLPSVAFAYFENIGRSLLDDEYIDFGQHLGKPVLLTKESRKRLILSSPKVEEYTEIISLRGSIYEANQRTNSFELLLANGTKVRGALDSQHWEYIMEAFQGFKNGSKVSISCVGLFSRYSALKQILSIESISLLDPNDIDARIDELRCLKAGWYDGKGFPISPDGLSWLSNCFVLDYGDNPLPFMYPTPEGNVFLEWSFSTHDISLEISFEDHRGEWHDLNILTKEYEEFTLDLDKFESWKIINDKIAAAAVNNEQ